MELVASPAGPLIVLGKKTVLLLKEVKGKVDVPTRLTLTDDLITPEVALEKLSTNIDPLIIILNGKIEDPPEGPIAEDKPERFDKAISVASNLARSMPLMVLGKRTKSFLKEVA